MSNRPSSTKPGHRSTGSASARVEQARQAGSGPARWWIVAVVAVVVIGALGIAVVISSRNRSTSLGVASAGFDVSPDARPDLVTGTVTVTGEALPEAPRASAANPTPTDDGVGRPAPTLVGQRFDGNPIAITGPGRPKVVMFVAHWCPHCQKEVPLITQHLGGRLPADVDLYGVSTGAKEDAANFPPGQWLRRENWPVPTLLDDAQSAAAQAYGVSSYPFFVAIDASGTVVARPSGELTLDQFDQLLAQARG